ncbi:MAG: helix-turn-helix transcriptional regulator [Lachnospiraceae bacterium]|nr:helix-turn-helix transcriptional regulator [Lachnospiraceae bacterium]
MNIEIANRLVELRKANNLSQEALAEKLGISRQAVSKWERAEASPDTDNLILLARLYNISLDELLKTDEEIIPEAARNENDRAEDNSTEDDRIGADNRETDNTEDTAPENGESGADKRWNDEEYVHVGFEGIHVKDKDGEVHVGWRGIHVMDKNDEVHIGKDGINVNGENLRDHIFTRRRKTDFPLGLIAIVIYIAIGFMYELWHPGWLIFFLVPIISSAIYAIKEKRADYFAYPVLVIWIFLCSGLVKNIWHPTWVLFLTIPVYYEMIDFFRDRKNNE